MSYKSKLRSWANRSPEEKEKCKYKPGEIGPYANEPLKKAIIDALNKRQFDAAARLCDAIGYAARQRPHITKIIHRVEKKHFIAKFVYHSQLYFTFMDLGRQDLAWIEYNWAIVYYNKITQRGAVKLCYFNTLLRMKQEQER